MAQKWNLQDIRPAEPRKRRFPKAVQPEEPATQDESVFHDSREEVPSVVIEDGTKKQSHNILIAAIIFVVVVGGAIGLSALLGKTELTVFPENRQPTINAEFTAYPDQRSDALSYEVMTLEATGERQVSASGQTEVREQATGIIEIIKTTTGAERLIKNTRFRSPEGLVFRIQESVVVPGAINDESGAVVPGRIQAEVFADTVGEQYNLPAGTDFDIPGYEEGGFTELYNAVKAVSVEAFTGGFDGLQFQIDEDELSTARQALQMELRDTLLARIDNEKPSDFISFPGSIALTYNELPAVEYGADLVTIKEQAVLQIPLFQATEFANFLASESVATYEGGHVRLDDPTELRFNYVNSTTSASVIANEPSLSFNLAGRPLLIWEYDADSLRQDLAGLPKTAVNNVINAYGGIEAARIRITPFWKRSFPDNPDEIQIIEELDQGETL
jgi:hypothetical protein